MNSGLKGVTFVQPSPRDESWKNQEGGFGDISLISQSEDLCHLGDRGRLGLGDL